MSTKISARTAASTLTGAETLGIIQGGADRRVTLALAAGDYVTPEKYGAVGDGTTDDTTAFQAALDTGARAVFAKNLYSITTGLQLKNDQIIFGLPKSMLKEDSPGSTTPRIIDNISGTGKVLIKNTAGTDGNGIQDLYIDMKTNPTHTAVQFGTSYGNIVKRVHLGGTFNIGVLSNDAYVSNFHDIVCNGSIVKTAVVFVDLCSSMSIERIHTSTAPYDTAACLYGVVVQQGNNNVVRDCIFQALTIGIATGNGTHYLENNYFEDALCCMRLGQVDAGIGDNCVIGGQYSAPTGAHSQYAKRGPMVMNYGVKLTMTHPVFSGPADNTTAQGPWPVWLVQGDVVVINPRHLGGSDPRERTLFYLKNGGASAQLTILGSTYGTKLAHEIILKSDGAYGTACRGIRVDNNGVIGDGAGGTTASAYTPAQAFAAVDALLTTALPTGASLIL
jgi:hypothetical protein